MSANKTRSLAHNGSDIEKTSANDNEENGRMIKSMARADTPLMEIYMMEICRRTEGMARAASPIIL